MSTLGVTRPLLLDTFCKAGGASMGYSRAGFDVVGVDIEPQKHYPFEFVQADALQVLAEVVAGHPRWAGVTAIHASPPCQLYSSTRFLPMARDKTYPDLIAPVQRLLDQVGVPWVLENVPGAPLRDHVTLCGSSFGRPLKRHRWFESSIGLIVPHCAHGAFGKLYQSTNPDGRKKKRLTRWVGVYGGTHYAGEGRLRRVAMGIDWMTLKELSQAIPPDYTELIGRQLIRALEVAA